MSRLTKTNLALAAVAVVFIVGFALAIWRYWCTTHRPATQPSETLLFIPDGWGAADHLDSLPQGQRCFWELFEGNAASARARREGGMFESDIGTRASIYPAPCDLTVVVVAEGPYHEWVDRFVCSRTDGIVFRRESRHPHDGYIDRVQARNTNRHGLQAAPDEKIRWMATNLGGCRRVVLIND